MTGYLNLDLHKLGRVLKADGWDVWLVRSFPFCGQIIRGFVRLRGQAKSSCSEQQTRGSHIILALPPQIRDGFHHEKMWPLYSPEGSIIHHKRSLTLVESMRGSVGPLELADDTRWITFQFGFFDTKAYENQWILVDNWYSHIRSESSDPGGVAGATLVKIAIFSVNPVTKTGPASAQNISVNFFCLFSWFQARGCIWCTCYSCPSSPSPLS